MIKALKRWSYYKKRKHYEYRTAKGICNQCALRVQCTKAKDGRSLKRHERQETLDLMRIKATSNQAKKDIKKRKDLAERTFARGIRYGYKRSRWRGLWRMQIQEYLIAAMQNIQVLVNNPCPKKAKAEQMLLETSISKDVRNYSPEAPTGSSLGALFRFNLGFCLT